MPEQDLNPAATKFISSLVRSLQILCNGQVEFNETIELVGHINVKIDHKYKFDYIVDEHVSKEGEDSSTTFLSNSYHSCRPTKQTNKKSEASALEQDVIFSGIPHNTQRRGKQMKNVHEMVEKHSDNSSLDRENAAQNYSVSVEPRDKQYNEHNQMVVKLEGGEDSNDCMVLPASPVDYEGEGNQTETFPVPGTSSSFNDSPGNQKIHSRKRRKVINQSRDTEMMPKVYSNTQRKNSVLFSCKEYLARYSSYCKVKNKEPDRNEMLKIFSDLAQKFGVAITIKPVKFTSQSVSSPSSQSIQQVYQPQNKCTAVTSMVLDTHQHSTLSKEIVLEDISPISSGEQILQLATSQYLSDTETTRRQRNFESKQVERNPYLNKANKIIVISKPLNPILNSDIACNDKVYSEDNELSSYSSATITLNSEDVSSVLLKEAQECIRQQPLPKRSRGSYLVKLRKEAPDEYERYKSLTKEEQARERRRISELNQDPDVLEKKNLMNRVIYLRKIGKLPALLQGKRNDEIREMHTADLKAILPPTRSLRNLDPAVREEWYRLGRSREWRRKKRLLDPEGFKRYNNDRAKKYQENLRNNNPEKFKELRAKAADRLRHYRYNQKVLNTVTEIKSPHSLGAQSLSECKNSEVAKPVENQEKSTYSLPDCASTHGEAATRRQSTSARTEHSVVQADILDLIYDYDKNINVL